MVAGGLRTHIFYRCRASPLREEGRSAFNLIKVGVRASQKPIMFSQVEPQGLGELSKG